MINIYISEDVRGNKLKLLLEFIRVRMTKVSISRYYNGGLELEELEDIQKRYLDSIVESDEVRRLYYEKNTKGYKETLDKNYSTKEKVDNYFDELLEQDMYTLDTICFQDYKKFDKELIQTEDCLENIFTRNTPVTSGPLFHMCYFKEGEVFNSIERNLESLFEFPYYIGELEFEDLAFYDEDGLYFAICSHEKFATLELEEKDFKRFQELGIDYIKH